MLSVLTKNAFIPFWALGLCPFKIWMELLAGTVLANNLLLAGTVSANKLLLAGTVPANKLLLAETPKT